MSGKQYLKNQLPVILINLLGMLVLALFLIASDNPIQTVLFIFAVWSIVLVLSLLAFYFSRKKYLNKLLNMTEQLEERYLLPEIMQVPERADEQVFYQIMKMAEKSMLERIVFFAGITLSPMIASMVPISPTLYPAFSRIDFTIYVAPGTSAD